VRLIDCSEISHQDQDASHTLLARIEELIDKVSLYSQTTGQHELQEDF